jgi:DNA-directed RNA polymerase specialized sigma24 family protein
MTSPRGQLELARRRAERPWRKKTNEDPPGARVRGSERRTCLKTVLQITIVRELQASFLRTSRRFELSGWYDSVLFVLVAARSVMATTDPPSVTKFLNDFKQGDPAAFDELWRRYFSRLVALARRRLQNERRLAGVDEEDIALSAFKSFHRRARRGDFPRLEDRDDLWVQLVTLTRQKLVDQERREGAIKRGRDRIRSEAELGWSHGGGEGAGLDAIVGEGTDPAFSAMMTEQCRMLLDRLGDDVLRKIALSKMGMATSQEIADQFGRSLSWVNRKLDLIRSIWEAGENSVD